MIYHRQLVNKAATEDVSCKYGCKQDMNHIFEEVTGHGCNWFGSQSDSGRFW